MSINFDSPESALDFIGKAIDLARQKRIAEFRLDGVGSFRLLPATPPPPTPRWPDLDPAESARKEKTAEQVESDLNEQWGVDAPNVTRRLQE